MNKTTSIIKKVLKFKVITAVLITVSIASFATLGDGINKKKTLQAKKLLTYKNSTTSKSFSLKSGYNYRGENLLSINGKKYFELNTVVTFNKGNTTYILPMKRKLLLDKVTFNPGGSSRSY